MFLVKYKLFCKIKWQYKSEVTKSSYKEVKDKIVIKSYKIYLKNKAFCDKLHLQLKYKQDLYFQNFYKEQ